ncbi:hypothetical protein LguiA_016302 [Lonicera macranthoides]
MATEQSVMALIRASRPTFRNSQDKVAFALHATFLASGYLLISTGPPAFTDDALSSSSSSSDEASIDQWNSFEDNYAFVYSNPEKDSKKVLVKCLVMNNKLLVDALTDGSSTPVHHEINIGDFAEENGGSNYSSQYKDLGKLVNTLNKDVLSKLSSSPKPTSSTQTLSTQGLRDDINRPHSGPRFHQPPYDPSGLVVPPIYPGVGGDDLFPGPGAGMYPSRGGFGGGSGGGMLIGPNHPGFGGIGGEPGFPGGQPSNVPPGARFDPYGPPGVPGFEPNRFVRDPRRPRGGGTHPDLQHFGSDDFI